MTAAEASPCAARRRGCPKSPRTLGVAPGYLLATVLVGKGMGSRALFVNLATKRVEWHRAVFPGAQSYNDLLGLEDGLVVGFADRTRLFVFDSRKREVVHVADTSAGPGPCVSHQGPRVFHRGPEGALYALLAGGIARIEPGTWRVELLATSPVPIDAGGDILDGRIWFASGSKLYSWTLPSP